MDNTDLSKNTGTGACRVFRGTASGADLHKRRIGIRLALRAERHRSRGAVVALAITGMLGAGLRYGRRPGPLGVTPAAGLHR